MQTMLFGIAGRARSGKSTAAMILADMLGLKLLTIAEPVTRACAGALGLEHHNFLRLPKGYHLPGLNMTKREFMQAMGDALISRNPNALIASLNSRRETDKQNMFLHSGHLITDIRTEAEAAWCRSKAGTVIHIVREAQEPSTHRTEQRLSRFDGDYTINNNGSEEEFREKCKMLGELLLQKLKEAV